MAGSGTTLDVARSLDRRALCYDIAPPRGEVFRADARKLPLEDGKADFVFVDPPYSDHIRYSGSRDCIGELSAGSRDYFDAMERVISEIHRILRPERYMALYVCDSHKKDEPVIPIGFELYAMLARRFEPVDIVAVVRHNASLKRNHWHTAAVEGNYFLRGFNYLFVMHKAAAGRGKGGRLKDRRDPAQVARHVKERETKGRGR
jgi:SAM-dependent methyltransferase